MFSQTKVSQHHPALELIEVAAESFQPSCGFVIARLARVIGLTAKLSRDIDLETGNTARGEKDGTALLSLACVCLWPVGRHISFSFSLSHYTHTHTNTPTRPCWGIHGLGLNKTQPPSSGSRKSPERKKTQHSSAPSQQTRSVMLRL